MRRRLDRIDATVMSGNTNRTRHVRPDAQSGPAKRKERGLAARRPAGRVPGRVRVRRPPPDIGGRLKGKERDRHVRFDERVGTGVAQEPHDRGVLLEGDQPGRTGIAHARREPGDAHGVLQADGHAGEGARPVALPREGLRLGYHHLGQAVCFPVRF